MAHLFTGSSREDGRVWGKVEAGGKAHSTHHAQRICRQQRQRARHSKEAGIALLSINSQHCAGDILRLHVAGDLCMEIEWKPNFRPCNVFCQRGPCNVFRPCNVFCKRMFLTQRSMSQATCACIQPKPNFSPSDLAMCFCASVPRITRLCHAVVWWTSFLQRQWQTYTLTAHATTSYSTP